YGHLYTIFNPQRDSLPSSIGQDLTIAIDDLVRGGLDHLATDSVYQLLGVRLAKTKDILRTKGQINDKECLTEWLKEEDGIYEVTFKSGSEGGYHVMALIKQDDRVYLWDPSHGLAKCQGATQEDQASTIVKFLQKYHETNKQHFLHFR